MRWTCGATASVKTVSGRRGRLFVRARPGDDPGACWCWQDRNHADGHAGDARRRRVKRWLVLAPKRVCTDVWPVEAPKWSGITPALAVGNPAQRAAAIRSDASVVVINYDNLDKLEDLSGFDGIVFDELTRLKNPSGKRFKALEKLLAHQGALGADRIVHVERP
jgi:hypothetical protein